MARWRQRPTEMCCGSRECPAGKVGAVAQGPPKACKGLTLFFLCGLRTADSSLECRIRSYELRQRFESPRSKACAAFAAMVASSQNSSRLMTSGQPQMRCTKKFHEKSARKKTCLITPGTQSVSAVCLSRLRYGPARLGFLRFLSTYCSDVFNPKSYLIVCLRAHSATVHC